MSKSLTIPVIDIFAGPGGLGEGFSSFETQGHLPFKIGLSIEKDMFAHKTLRLRSFFRQFPKGDAPDLYYDALQQKFPLEQFADRLKDKSQSLWKSWSEANQETMKAELGSSQEQHREISNRISKVIGKKRDWVLIGGPPCQAYSLAGRVRNKGIKNYRIEDDKRSTLYREYLRIIAEHRPAVFVMENVKGMLSATLENQKIFEQILCDLRVPPNASPKLRYRVLPVAATDEFNSHEEYDPRQFIVACEKYGIPQQRHRVILIGIREDLGDVELPPLNSKAAPTVNSVISLLPRLRSGLSRTVKGDKYLRLEDDADSWIKSIQTQIGINDTKNSPRWLNNLNDELRSLIIQSVNGTKRSPQDRGSGFVRKSKTLKESHPLYEHFIDKRLPGVCNHETRSHLDRDLVRYLFAAAYSKHHGISPRLHQFPTALLPSHKNANSGNFNDRFRVQLGNQPSTTITSHISKDGHYFIHPDPTQCRSLTVREAARLQTFPDNYFFCGPRTEQYSQVGNAVPPWLAQQIAESVWRVLDKSRKANL